MIKMAVAGKPIGHSLSPLLHKTAYQLLGIEADFLTDEISEDQFGEYYFIKEFWLQRVSVNNASQRDFTWIR